MKGVILKDAVVAVIMIVCAQNGTAGESETFRGGPFGPLVFGGMTLTCRIPAPSKFSPDSCALPRPPNNTIWH